ncbi:chromosome replication initiation inhibitor protein [Moritella marina ATCC 15381]|uniref:Chromosome replication initiation inhibitor protein n=1 Tax=Moritella marina ATCC 15381 TaxID=1202962 RepID=A0A5J6WMJ5_MORMI|nr:hypothetical protein [Moritella marina]QFI38471.1 chromosome replication initiation inhibitor protein [Moritella marina ATCC 15381]
MFSLLLRVISPFFIFLGIMFLYSYGTGQDSRQILDALLDLVSLVGAHIADAFNQP